MRDTLAQDGPRESYGAHIGQIVRDTPMKRATAGLIGIMLAGSWKGLPRAEAGGEERGKWVEISDSIVQKLEQEGKKPAWPGGTGGLTVDRVSGDVYMVVCGQGLWKSVDHGKTFDRCDGGKIGGRCETGYALDFDPIGQRLACFMLDGSAGMTLDGGKSWSPLNDGSRGQDVACVDWSQAAPRNVFAIRHESGGLGQYSTNGGRSWKEVGKDFLPSVGIFDGGIVVSSKGKGILRSLDGGATWTTVSDFTPNPGVVRSFKGIGYWLTKDRVIYTKDRGATWLPLGSPVRAGWGPYFGKTDKHMVVVGKDGFFETLDGGGTWAKSIPLPDPANKAWPASDGLDRLGWFLNFGWDPNADIFYASKMGKATVRFRR